jgi:hypothetical protein
MKQELSEAVEIVSEEADSSVYTLIKDLKPPILTDVSTPISGST